MFLSLRIASNPLSSSSLSRIKPSNFLICLLRSSMIALSHSISSLASLISCSSHLISALASSISLFVASIWLRSSLICLSCSLMYSAFCFALLRASFNCFLNCSFSSLAHLSLRLIPSSSIWRPFATESDLSSVAIF